MGTGERKAGDGGCGQALHLCQGKCLSLSTKSQHTEAKGFLCFVLFAEQN